MHYANTHGAFLSLNLQLFAEGGGAEGGTGTSGTADVGLATPTKGAKNPLANVQYGKQTDVQTADAQTTVADDADGKAPDLDADFESLIKGQYKEQYNKRVQDTVQKRLKNAKENEDRLNTLTPMLELLGKRYGVDASDVQALSKAMEDDDSYYEDEAYEKGLSVEQLKAIKKMERENAEFKRAEQEREQKANQDRILAEWTSQAESAKAIYPNLDLNVEAANPQFAQLLKAGIDVKTAFEVVHKDEIIPAAMQYTAQQTKKAVVDSIRANGNRPVENGSTSSATATVKSDVSQLTKADRQEIARRVARGERISF